MAAVTLVVDTAILGEDGRDDEVCDDMCYTLPLILRAGYAEDYFCALVNESDFIVWLFEYGYHVSSPRSRGA